MTVATSSVAKMVQLLRDSKLLEAAQLEALKNDWAKSTADLRGLSRDLLRRGWLTPYQVNQLLQGHGGDLILGQYVLLERLGEGGMGQVFKARHQRLDRIVALKVIRKEHLSNELAVRRFRREIQVVSQLAHPNIVLAYDADEVNGTHFFVMEYVEGTDLGQMVKQSGPLPVAVACDYLRQTALGLQHAFERGLVHRDIKPANLLVATAGSMIKILDLGLARISDTEEEASTASLGSLTQDGKVVGTPDYMSPEQARNSHTIDIRADLYSLGCTAHFILTGQVVFPGGTAMEKLFQHQMEAPAPVEKLRPEVPPQLGAVVRRLLAKRPEDRYQTPADLVRALEPFCGGHPTAAALGTTPSPSVADTDAWSPAVAVKAAPRPAPGPMPKSPARANPAAPRPAPVKLAAPKPAPAAAPPSATSRRRKRRLMLMTSVAVVGLIGGVALFSFLYARFGGNRSATTETSSLSPLLDPSRVPTEERVPGQPRELVAVFGEHRGRNWNAVRNVALSPDGKRVLSIGSDNVVRQWDAATLREVAMFRTRHNPQMFSMSAIAPDGRTVAISNDGTGKKGGGGVTLWDVATGKERLTVPAAPAAGASVMRFTSDSRTLIVAGRGEVKGWDAASGAETINTRVPEGGNQFFLAPNGETVASAVVSAKEGAKRSFPVKVWDARTGKERGVFKGHNALAGSLAFAPDGRLAASVAADYQGPAEIKVWDAKTGEERYSARATNPNLSSLVFAPDGKTLALIAPDGNVKLWEPATGQERPLLSGGGFGSQVVAFAADGKALVTGGHDNAVRLWDTATGQELLPQKGRRWVRAVAFTADAKGLAVIMQEREGNRFVSTVRLWDVNSVRERPLSRAPKGDAQTLVFAPDGKSLFLGCVVNEGARSSGVVQLLDLQTGNETFSQTFPGSGVMAVAYASDGRSVAAGLMDGTAKVWDTASGRELASCRPYNTGVRYLTFASGGKTLVLVGWEAGGGRGTGLVKVWDVAANRDLSTYRESSGGLHPVAIAPDGNSLIGACWEPGAKSPQVAKFIDLAQGRERLRLSEGPGGLMAFAYSPDGQVLASANLDGHVVLWDTASGKKLQDLELPGPVHQLAFAGDGRHLATGNGNGTVYVLRLSGLKNASR